MRKFAHNSSRRTSYPKSCFRELSSGDIRVLANCKDLSVFKVSRCSNITGKFRRSFSRVTKKLPFTNFPRNFAGDICVMQHLTNLTEFYARGTKIDGKLPRDFPAR